MNRERELYLATMKTRGVSPDAPWPHRICTACGHLQIWSAFSGPDGACTDCRSQNELKPVQAATKPASRAAATVERPRIYRKRKLEGNDATSSPSGPFRLMCFVLGPPSCSWLAMVPWSGDADFAPVCVSMILMVITMVKKVMTFLPNCRNTTYVELPQQPYC